MGGSQDYGPFLGPLNTRCRSTLRTPKRDHDFDNHPHPPHLSRSAPVHYGSKVLRSASTIVFRGAARSSSEPVLRYTHPVRMLPPPPLPAQFSIQRLLMRQRINGLSLRGEIHVSFEASQLVIAWIPALLLL